MQLDEASALWMGFGFFFFSFFLLIWPHHFLVRGVEIKALVVVGNEI